MNAENRRSRLKLWFSSRAIPEREKSYLSQLLNGKASFGEKAARRLERDYRMGDGYLDIPIDTPANTVNDDLPAIMSLLNQMSPHNLGIIRGKIEVWAEILAGGNNKTTELPTKENSNLERRIGTQ